MAEPVGAAVVASWGVLGTSRLGLVFGDQFAHSRHEFPWDLHGGLRCILECRFVLGDRLLFGLLLVVGKDPADSFPVPSRWKPDGLQFVLPRLQRPRPACPRGGVHPAAHERQLPSAILAVAPHVPGYFPPSAPGSSKSKGRNPACRKRSSTVRTSASPCWCIAVKEMQSVRPHSLSSRD